MNGHQLQILAEAKKFVKDIFQNKVFAVFVFHNLDHTMQVVNAAKEIEEYYQLDDNDPPVLFVSAWFHDTGFSTENSDGHEKESIKLANDFLFHCNADPRDNIADRILHSGNSTTTEATKPGGKNFV